MVVAAFCFLDHGKMDKDKYSQKGKEKLLVCKRVAPGRGQILFSR